MSDETIIVEMVIYPEGQLAFNGKPHEVSVAIRMVEKGKDLAYEEGKRSVINTIIKNIEKLAS